MVPHLLENSSIHIELNPQLCFASVEICRSCVEPAVFSPPQLRRVFLAAHKHLQLRFLDVLVVISHGAKRRPKKKTNTKKAFVNNLIGFGSSDVCTCPLGGDKIL